MHLARTWDRYVEEHNVRCVERHPGISQVVEFAVWLSYRRERACLAERVESGCDPKDRERTQSVMCGERVAC